jgi:folate-dependent phosphoribosylglycinamide formyltransferase PurN
MLMMKKIVVITNGNYFARIILEGLICHKLGSIKGILIVTGDYKGRTGLRAIWEIGKVTTFPYLVYKMVTQLAFTILQILYSKSKILVRNQGEKSGIPVCKVAKVNSDKAISWVKTLSPDLIVSVSCPQLIRCEMLEIAPLAINIHSSLLPTFAGLAPYFWVLSAGETETATTVHYMTNKFDEGNILIQKRVNIQPKESAYHLFQRLAQVGSDALLEAVDKTLEGDKGLKQDITKYTYFSNPNFRAYQKLRENGHCLIRLRELYETISRERRQSLSSSKDTVDILDIR